MSRIDEIVRLAAPGGVEYKTLGQVANIKNGKDHKHLGPGTVPVYGSGGVLRHADTAVAYGPSVLIPRKGSLGNVFYVEGPFWVVDTIFRTEPDREVIEPKFLYYSLLTMRLAQMNQAGGVPSQTQTVLNSLRIAVPPVEVQRAVVRILDQFSQVEAELEVELEAELEARRRQYEHYRDQLLTFRGQAGVRWIPMGDIGTIFGGLTGKSKAHFTDGNARFIAYTNVYNNIAVDLHRDDSVRVEPGEKQRALECGDVLFTGSSETLGEVAMSSVVTSEPTKQTYLNSFSIGFRPTDSELFDPEFSKHLFRSSELRRQLIGTASGVTRFNVSKSRLAKVLVPIPARDLQKKIAETLDRFERLANDLSTGLPAELASRRKQYEYYRDKLLTFEELPA